MVLVDCVNRDDVDGLGRLMSEDHVLSRALVDDHRRPAGSPRRTAAARSTGRASPAGPGRVALLEERADALLRVGGEHVHRHHGLREVVGARLVEVDLGVEGLLADPDGEAARARRSRRRGRRPSASSASAGTTRLTSPQSSAVARVDRRRRSGASRARACGRSRATAGPSASSRTGRSSRRASRSAPPRRRRRGRTRRRAGSRRRSRSRARAR